MTDNASYTSNNFDDNNIERLFPCIIPQIECSMINKYTADDKYIFFDNSIKEEKIPYIWGDFPAVPAILYIKSIEKK